MPTEQALDDKPPYISFTTLLNFFERLGSGPVPPRIDKSALDTYSGGTQAVLLSTLRAMDFIDANGNVRDSLREAAISQDARKAYLAKYARQTYAEQIRLAEQNGTAQMLHETFSETGYSGSTLRKAVVFYLALVEYLSLPNSPHFRPPKQTQAARRPRRSAEPVPAPVVAPATPTAVASGQTRVIHIGDAATITLTVEAQWLDLPIEAITKLRKAIDDLESLASPRMEPEEEDEYE